jgi:hypothetical protein
MVNTNIKSLPSSMEVAGVIEKNICKTGGNKIPKDSIPSCVRAKLRKLFNRRRVYVTRSEK